MVSIVIHRAAHRHLQPFFDGVSGFGLIVAGRNRLLVFDGAVAQLCSGKQTRMPGIQTPFSTWDPQWSETEHAMPVIDWESGWSLTGDGLQRRFNNKGGWFKIAAVRILNAPATQASFSPRNHIANGQKGFVTFKGGDLDKLDVTFEIHYAWSLGEGFKKFRYQRGANIEEVE